MSTTAAIINDQNIPATNFIGTLVQFDVDGNVSKFEKVLVAIFSGGNVTMTRAFNGSTAQTFNANDYIFVNVVSEIIADIQAEIAAKQATASKDASGGYVGLTLFKINFKNVLNTFTSFFTNSNTAARTYTFQDRNGIIADDTDIAAARAYADGLVVGLWDDRGNYDASG